SSMSPEKSASAYVTRESRSGRSATGLTTNSDIEASNHRGGWTNAAKRRWAPQRQCRLQEKAARPGSCARRARSSDAPLRSGRAAARHGPVEEPLADNTVALGPFVPHRPHQAPRLSEVARGGFNQVDLVLLKIGAGRRIPVARHLDIAGGPFA